MHGRIDGQVPDRDGTPLQQQPEGPPSHPQPPANDEQDKRRQRDGRITQLERYDHALRRVAEQKGQAEEQQQYADASRSVAAQEPTPRPREGALGEAWLEGLRRRWRRHVSSGLWRDGG